MTWIDPEGPCVTDYAPTIDDTMFVPLEAELTGTLHLPGDPDYTRLSSAFNLAVPVRPRAVVAVATVNDVARTVVFAAQHGLRVLPQRTGHGTLPLDAPGGDVILLHTGELAEITVDAPSRTAQVGAGALWGDLIPAVAEHGLAALGGSAPTVGVAGLLTGAGMGPLNRTYGLASDHVRAFEVVTGDGQIRTASADENPDLFWGLRGGRATLGIVTRAELGLVPLERFYGGALFFDIADAAAVLNTWREWGATLPEHASTSVAIMNLPPLPQFPPPIAGRFSVSVRFASVADAATAEAVLTPIRAAGTPIMDGIGELPYSQIARVHNEPLEPAPTADASVLLSEFPAEAVDALLAAAGPGSGSPLVAVELRLLGGAMASAQAPECAFDHRSAPFNLFAIGILVPPVTARVPGHLQQVAAVMEPWASGGALPNWAIGARPSHRSYREQTFQRLAELGDRYDPAGVFKVGQVARF